MCRARLLSQFLQPQLRNQLLHENDNRNTTNKPPQQRLPLTLLFLGCYRRSNDINEPESEDPRQESNYRGEESYYTGHFGGPLKVSCVVCVGGKILSQGLPYNEGQGGFREDGETPRTT
jgi:hypothetical protein